MVGRMLILSNFVFQEDVSQFLSFTDFQTSRPRKEGVIIQSHSRFAGLTQDPGAASEIVIKEGGHQLPASTLSEIL